MISGCVVPISKPARPLNSGWPCLTPPYSGIPNQLEENSIPLAKVGLPWHNDRYCIRKTVPQTWRINGAYWSHTEIPDEETGFTAPEQLAGKLCWAANVVSWGTTHTRPIFTLLSSLKQADHKKLISGIKWDLIWWLSWLQNGQNRSRIWLPTTCLNMYTDACSTAGRGFCQGDWMYMCWLYDSPSFHPHHINTKELAAVVMSALWVPPMGRTSCYSPQWQCCYPRGYQ